MVLYGLVGALFAYSAGLIVKSPLGTFALVAGYQVLMFIVWFSNYFMICTSYLLMPLIVAISCGLSTNPHLR